MDDFLKLYLCETPVLFGGCGAFVVINILEKKGFEQESTVKCMSMASLGVIHKPAEFGNNKI